MDCFRVIVNSILARQFTPRRFNFRFDKALEWLARDLLNSHL